ncbi:MAG: toll/interleukin-1 receptor domain-containing protein [Anaerolineae bacterium]
MSESYLFISHSSADNEAVREIVQDLQADTLRVWVDFDKLESGSLWLNTIQDAIDGCAGVLVILSNASRRSDWVMRECLYAMQLRKPLFIALIDNIPLPLLLVDRQFTSLTASYEEGLARLIPALATALAHPPERTYPITLPESVSLDANESNFFAYLAQMEEGEALAQSARELYQWGQKTLTACEFSGRFRPALHGRVTIGNKQVTVFSVLAYLHHPAVQVPLDYLRKYPPFTDDARRLTILRQLETLLPEGEHFEEERMDRRPTVPLVQLAQDSAQRLSFQQIIARIADDLR